MRLDISAGAKSILSVHTALSMLRSNYFRRGIFDSLNIDISQHYKTRILSAVGEWA